MGPEDESLVGGDEASEEAAEEAAFMAEYVAEIEADSPNLVAAAPKTGDPEPKAEEEPAPPAPTEEAAANPLEGAPTATPDRFTEFEDRMTKRMRNIEGTFGGFKSEIMNALAARDETKATGAEAPTAAAITAAAGSSEKLEALKGEFPEWSDALDEQVGAMEARLVDRFNPEGIQKGVADGLTTQMNEALGNSATRLRQVLRVDLAHPDWEDTINTPGFKDWMPTQTEEIQALANSPMARDAIKLLDMYSDTTKTADKKAEAEDKKAAAQARLAAAVTPTRGGTVAQGGPTEEDDFIAAFNA